MKMLLELAPRAHRWASSFRKVPVTLEHMTCLPWTLAIVQETTVWLMDTQDNLPQSLLIPLPLTLIIITIAGSLPSRYTPLPSASHPSSLVIFAKCTSHHI